MDKDNVHINSEFIDHSWQEMSKLLDQEMPIKKQRKKRLLWIWLLGLGLFGLIGFTYYLNTSSQPPLKSFKVPHKRNVVKLNNSPSGTSQPSTNTPKTSKKQRITKSSDNLNLVNTNKKVSKTHPTAANAPAVVGIGITTEKKSIDLPINQIIKEKEKFLSPTQIEYPTRNSAVITPIAILKPNLLNTQKSFTFVIPSLIGDQKKWRFGLYAGGTAPKIGGVNLGLQTNYLFHKKWSLHFGLGYSKRIVTSTTSETANQDASTPIELTAETEDMSTASGSNTGPAPPPNTTPNEAELIPGNDFKYTNFHYFEIPILFQYTIRKKLVIEFGGSIGYLYGYRYQYNGASFFTKDIISNSNNAFGTRSVDLSQANLGTVSNFNTTLIGGINYRFTKNITGYTNYRISNKYLNNTNIAANDFNFPQRWKQIEVGIRYYFK